MTTEWINLHYPIAEGDKLPAERRPVLCWIGEHHLPRVGYIRYSSGCKDAPFFVVPSINASIGTLKVTAWCDCFPPEPPGDTPGFMQPRGFPARPEASEEALRLMETIDRAVYQTLQGGNDPEDNGSPVEAFKELAEILKDVIRRVI